jgi:hypothetical protein
MGMRSQGFTLGYSLDLPSGGMDDGLSTRTIRLCDSFFLQRNVVSTLAFWRQSLTIPLTSQVATDGPDFRDRTLPGQQWSYRRQTGYYSVFA